MSGALPKNWLTVGLSQVIVFSKGKKPNILLKEMQESFVPYVDIKAFEKGIIDEYADIQSSKLIDQNDVLVVWDGARCGLPGIGLAGAAGSTLMVLKPVLSNPRFLYHFLMHCYKFINSKPKGTGTPHVNPDVFWSLPFPIVPLNEQKRIVAKLDAIMPRIDSVKERLEKIPAILKRFRQSVLTAAVTGKLTEKWREEHPEVESAEELLESIFKAKQALFKQNGVSKSKIVDESDIFFSTPVNWKWCRLSEITLKMSTGPFGTMLHKSDYIDNGIPIINPTNIIGEKIIASDKITISKSKYEELLRYSLKENNIVLARRGDLSKCGIVRKEQSNWLCGTGSFFLEVAISPVYFRLFYVSNYCQAPLNEDSIGSTMSNLNQSVLSNIAFPLPPLDEQKEIVRQVDKLFALADKVEEYYRKARARVDALAQSVLAKAFRGELVPQDPDDEPAEKLLQRIKEEKTKMEAELKTVSRSARGTRRNGAKTQRAGAEEKQASEP